MSRRLLIKPLAIVALTAATLAPVAPLAAVEAPWKRHTIASGLRGADGARMADVNGDGHRDIVCAWEQSGVVEIYLNPGRADVKKPWRSIRFDGIPDVEDAVLADVDGNGLLDVVSACEGDTRNIYVHWAPKDRSEYLDAAKWDVNVMRPVAGNSQWMFCLPMQVDNKFGIDLIVGSKNTRGNVSLLQAPANPRETESWQVRKISDAGWVMSLIGRDMDSDGDLDVLLSDRKGPQRSVRWLENPGPELAAAGDWTSHLVGGEGEEAMFIEAADFDGDGLEDVIAATRDHCLFLRRLDRTGRKWHPHTIAYPPSTGEGKAVAVGDINSDGKNDLVITFEGAERNNRSGVVWMETRGSAMKGPFIRREISGAVGVKYDMAVLYDLDGDDDLDVITTEESSDKNGLGLIWYENPRP